MDTSDENFSLLRGTGTCNPGLSWSMKAGDNTILLGYNAKAPTAPSDVEIINKYYYLLQNPDELYKPKSDIPVVPRKIIAWLQANASHSDLLGDNACAIDKNTNYFYLITYNRGKI